MYQFILKLRNTDLGAGKSRALIPGRTYAHVAETPTVRAGI